MLEFFFELGQKIERRIAGWVGTFSFIECPLSLNKGYLYPTSRNKGPFLDRSLSLFYFLPQESHRQARSASHVSQNFVKLGKAAKSNY